MRTTVASAARRPAWARAAACARTSEVSCQCFTAVPQREGLLGRCIAGARWRSVLPLPYGPPGSGASKRNCHRTTVVTPAALASRDSTRKRPHISGLSCLLSKALESVRQRRPPVRFVGEVRDEQRERLGVAGHPKRARVDRLEPDAADELCGR